MTNPILIGVGGTGQTVLAAYLRLATMAGFTPAPFYIVDSDNRGPLSTTLNQLRSNIKQIAGGELSARWIIDPYPTSQTERKTFGALFGSITGDRREVFNCLFSEDAELTPIRTGMYGRPSIGATCIRYKILQDDVDLKQLKDTLRGGAKHIILVGSCFGGTGSGGVPMLASEFFKLNQEQGYSLKIDALSFLPWFRLVLPDGITKASDKSMYEHLNSNFEPNAAASINYFKDKIKDYVDTLLLIGVRDPGQISRICNESSQGETPHILNLLAAIIIQSHFTGNLNPPKGAVGYWYEEREGLAPQELMVYRDGDSKPISLLGVLKRTSLQIEWLQILKTFFENYQHIPFIHRPIFIELSLKMLMGTVRKESEILREYVNHISKTQQTIKESFTCVEEMVDGQLFKLETEDKRPSSDKYMRMREDPLPVIIKWCDDEELIDRFENKDFQTSDIFCEKFVTLFIDHLARDYKL
jgi:hypothetical protein